MSNEFAKSLVPAIRTFLSKADLDLVSAKAVRKALVIQGESEAQIKANKADVDAIIADIFYELRAAAEPSAVKVESSSVDVKPTVIRKRSRSPELEVEDEEDTAAAAQPAAKKKKKKSTTITRPPAMDDEAYARALQAELNGLGRSGRTSRSGKTGTPAKAKTKPKSKTSAKTKVKSSAYIKDGSDSDDPGYDTDNKVKKVSVKSEKAVGAETGFNRPMLLSPNLSALLGETHLSRPKTVKALWQHIKGNDLQDPKDKRFIQCDESMRAVFNIDRLNMMTMNKLLSNHLFNPDEIVG